MLIGMPTLIETNTINECAAVCRELNLNFVEINMSMPQYTLDAIDVPYFKETADRYKIAYTIHLDENVKVCDFNSYISTACCNYISDTIRLSKKLSIPVINMHMSRGEYISPCHIREKL